MKLSTLLLATLISAMPSYKPSKGKCKSKMSNKVGGYEHVNVEKPSDMQSNGDGSYEDYNKHEPFDVEFSQGPSNGGSEPKGSTKIIENQESSENSNPKKNTEGDQANPNDQQKLEELNAIRAKVGAPPLQLSLKLNHVAQKHSDDQAQMEKAEHTGSNGSEVKHRVEEAGINWGSLAENVAGNQRDWSEATESWVNSREHYENMINEGFKYVGFGVTNKYYTEVFSNAD